MRTKVGPCHDCLEAIREREFPPEMINQAITDGPGSLLFSRGWLARPDISTQPPVDKWHIGFFGPDGELCEPFVFAADAKLSTDGS